jgi:acetyl esterase
MGGRHPGGGGRGRRAGRMSSDTEPLRIPPDLAPESREIFTQMATLGLLDQETATVEEMRALALAERPLMGSPPPVAQVEEVEIETPAGALAVRLYRPSGPEPERAILWMHGGGWVLGDLDHTDVDCRGLCRDTGSLVASVDYRLAPEHPFPAGLEDAHAALRWLSAELGSAGGPRRLVVAGDSAGGNLAAALCRLARERGGPAIDHQLLIYPATSYDCDSESHLRFADGYVLTRKAMLEFWELYTQGPAAGHHALASVLRAPDLRGLPAATFVVAGCDVLRDEAEAYADRLRTAAVPVDVLRYPGQLHSFWTYAGVSDIARVVNADIRASFEQREQA